MKTRKLSKQKAANRLAFHQSNTFKRDIEISIVGKGFDAFYEKCKEFNIVPELYNTIPDWPFSSTFTAECNGSNLDKLLKFAKSEENIQPVQEAESDDNIFSVWRVTQGSRVVF